MYGHSYQRIKMHKPSGVGAERIAIVAEGCKQVKITHSGPPGLHMFL